MKYHNLYIIIILNNFKIQIINSKILKLNYNSYLISIIINNIFIKKQIKIKILKLVK